MDICHFCFVFQALKLVFFPQMCPVVPLCTTTTRATQTLRTAVTVTPAPVLLPLFIVKMFHIEVPVKVPKWQNWMCPVSTSPSPSPYPSLVKALRSLANRHGVSVSPLANQQHVHVSIGSGSGLTPASRIPE